MARIGYLSFAVTAVFAIFMAVSFQGATALKCWKCSSDSPDGAFCNDPFDETAISPRQKRWSYVTCPNKTINAVSGERRPACKKIIQLVAGKEVIARACHWERLNSTKNDCMNTQTVTTYIQTEFCETCTTNGCNGAAQNDVGGGEFPSNDDEN